MLIHDTISKNTLPLFKRQQLKQISKASLKLTVVTSDHYHLKSTKRIGVVWDEEVTREKRGKSMRQKVAGHVKLPQNWKAFLEHFSTKKELFNFLMNQVETASFPADKVVYITSGKMLTNF